METVIGATWERRSDIQKFYTTVSIFKNSRVIFNIKDNDYQLVAKINY